METRDIPECLFAAALPLTASFSLHYLHVLYGSICYMLDMYYSFIIQLADSHDHCFYSLRMVHVPCIH